MRRGEKGMWITMGVSIGVALLLLAFIVFVVADTDNW